MNKYVIGVLAGLAVGGGALGVAAAARRRSADDALPEPPYFVYVVQAGDTLSALAKDFFGDAAKWPVLHQAMPGLPPNVDALPVGAKIRVPCLWYTVKPGDNLAKIAQATLGDGGRWARIAKANKKTLPNPDMLAAGQRLAVPVEHPQVSIGKGGGGGGGRGGSRHPWGGGPFARGGWVYPFVIDETPLVSSGVDIDQVLAADDAEAEKSLAKEIVKQLKAGTAKVGGLFEADLSDLDLLGAEVLGDDGKASSEKGSGGGGGLFGDFGISSILNLASKGAETGISLYQKDQAQKASSAAEQKRIEAAIKADGQATAAAVRADLSAQLAAGAGKDPKKAAQAAADASTAATMANLQAATGAGLSPAAQEQRLQAAQTALQSATDALASRPGDAAAIARVTAWNKTLNKISSAGLAGPSSGGPFSEAKESGGTAGKSIDGWLSGKTGPVPNKLIAGGGAVVAGVVVLKALLK